MATVRKVSLVAIGLSVLLAVVAFGLYASNRTPSVPTVSAIEAIAPTRPYVIKIHAQWCPVCMVTKGVWSQIEAAYAKEVNLVVFDFTNQETTDASRAEANRLGLTTVFDENDGWTGTILVVDGRSKRVAAAIHGSRDFDEYRAAIESVLPR